MLTSFPKSQLMVITTFTTQSSTHCVERYHLIDITKNTYKELKDLKCLAVTLS